MASRVVGLGHVGIYVSDMERMTAFYRDFMGMTLTKSRPPSMAFFSTDPERSDHEIALMAGRPSPEDPHLINQISLRVESLDDVRDFYRRIKAEGLEIVQLVTHVSAIGCYFKDPEGNTTEVFWLTGLPSWVNISAPIDIERPDEEIMDEIRGYWEKVRHVQVGEEPDAETQAAIAAMIRGGAVAAPR